MRPSYPAELLDDVVALAGLPCRAVDVGAGTGKATIQLAERGVVGVAVEPDPAMARVVAGNLAGTDGWRIEGVDFEAWRPQGGEPPFDLITAAHSWHWIDETAGVRQAERLLRPGGRLAIWRYDHVPSGVPVERAIAAAYAVHARELVGATRTPRWRTVPADAGFDGIVERFYPWSVEYSADEWVALSYTFSDHIALPPARMSRLSSAVARAIETHGYGYRREYVCRLWVGERI
jgi:SAM-dependent methyltransferase